MIKNQKKTYSLLIVDDEEGFRHGLSNLFRKQGYQVFSEGNYEQALSLAQEEPVDVVLLDIRLRKGKSGIDLLKEMKAVDPDLIIIMITGFGSIDTAVRSMKEGANDYILKPIDNNRILETVKKNLQLRNLQNENLFLKKELQRLLPRDRYISNTPYIRSLLEKADKIKNNPVTVLITGESGTGKEVFARYIHYTSNRKDQPFVGINCAALSETLLLSELFGHEKGAFTGALERKAGKFEIADGGTLFLDEIGDMDLDIQAKLLRVIEQSSFERLGGTKQINIDVRIIAATNKNLHKLIAEGKFREDLYYRINVVHFHLTPLRERREDIPLLLKHFIEHYNKKYNKNIENFSDEAIAELKSYSWPGNVRELQNFVNQTVLLWENAIIDEKALRQHFHAERDNGHDIPVDIDAIGSLKEAEEQILYHYEKRIIERALSKNANNKTKTAEDLCITRKTLADKMKKYNIAGTEGESHV